MLKPVSSAAQFFVEIHNTSGWVRLPGDYKDEQAARLAALKLLGSSDLTRTVTEYRGTRNVQTYRRN